jgi:hypothetical protein
MLATIIILSILLLLLTGALISTILIARAQYIRANKYEQILGDYDVILDEFGEDVLTTYQHIKNIDDKQMFEKDDDVGGIFQDMVELIEKFNKKTQAKLER